MRSATFPPASIRRRATSLGLAVAAHVLVVLLLLRLAPRAEEPPPADAPLTTFNVAPEARERARQARPRAAAARTRASEKAAAVTPPPPKTPARTEPETPAPPMLMIPGLFESADIGKMRGSADDGAGSSGSGDSVAASGPGEGPGGQKLYNAEWYREPSRAELAGYLQGGAPPGSWALIACRTVPNFQVDNCRSLGEGPMGSGLARAMRQAAWQFRIRPPRVGGKTMVGAWVRIRIDFSKEPGETN